MLSCSKGFGSTSSSNIYGLSRSTHHLTEVQLARKRPKETKLDLEKMYQDSIELYKVYAHLMRQNQSIRAELAKVDTMKSSRQELISSVQGVITQKSKQLKSDGKSSSWLVYKLRKQIDLLRKEIQAKQKIITEYCNSQKNFVLKQKEAERQVLEELLSRLKIRHDSEPRHDEIQDLFELKTYSENQTQRIQELEATLEAEEKECKKVFAEMTLRKREDEKIKEQNQQLRTLEEMGMLRTKARRSSQQQDSTAKQNSPDLQELELMKQLKAEQVVQLEQTIQKIIEREKAERKRLQKQLASILENKPSAVANKPSNKQIRSTKILNLQPVQAKKELTNSSNMHLSTHKSTESERDEPMVLLPKVKPAHIAAISRYLKYNLTVKKYTHDRWKEQVVQAAGEFESLSIRTLIQILKRPPFEIPKHEDAKLLARYLVEDSPDQKLFYDQRMSQTLPIIKSILEKIIGHIKIYEPTEEATILTEAGGLLHKYKGLIMPALEAKAPKGVDYLNEREMVEVIDNCMIDLTPVHLEYLVLYLFSYSKDLDRLPLKKIQDMGQVPLKYQN